MMERIRPKQEIALQRKQILQNLIKKQNNGAFDVSKKKQTKLLATAYLSACCSLQ